jgi:hypothetical protein
MLKIAPDGGADMEDAWLDKYQIHGLPHLVRFGEISCL